MTLDMHPMLVVTLAVIWALVKIYAPTHRDEWSDHDD